MIFGPVSAAQQSQPTVGGALFSLGVGVSVLTYLWYRFWNRAEEEPKPPLGNVIWMSVICCVFIAAGIWELVHALGV